MRTVTSVPIRYESMYRCTPSVYVYGGLWVRLTCGLRHGPLSGVLTARDAAALRAGLLPVFVAPLPVWMGLEMGLFNLGTGRLGKCRFRKDRIF